MLDWMLKTASYKSGFCSTAAVAAGRSPGLHPVQSPQPVDDGAEPGAERHHRRHPQVLRIAPPRPAQRHPQHLPLKQLPDLLPRRWMRPQEVRPLVRGAPHQHPRRPVEAHDHHHPVHRANRYLQQPPPQRSRTCKTISQEDAIERRDLGGGNHYEEAVEVLRAGVGDPTAADGAIGGGIGEGPLADGADTVAEGGRVYGHHRAIGRCPWILRRRRRRSVGRHGAPTCPRDEFWSGFGPLGHGNLGGPAKGRMVVAAVQIDKQPPNPLIDFGPGLEISNWHSVRYITMREALQTCLDYFQGYRFCSDRLLQLWDCWGLFVPLGVPKPEAISLALSFPIPSVHIKILLTIIPCSQDLPTAAGSD
ncbi:hypothetical protein OPV22_030421 [Ensete ventricosum]|uniref:Aminotransferase-like plant mobile domain-containing protein n=1 Tax=Ensete ventricosum TaxID=4639 RepID=A0AAV8Q9S8_ENSVE|nr:hypothetical protein OPV22_030421 [Ensete ventricosum]